MSTASTTVPYSSGLGRVADGVGEAEAEGDGEEEGDGDADGDRGGKVVGACGCGRAVGAATAGGGSFAGYVMTYAPPATIVAPALRATAGLVRAPSTLPDQPTEAAPVAATAVLPPRASDRVRPTGSGTSAIPTRSRSAGTTTASLGARAVGAPPDVPGQPLAPHGVRVAVPADGQFPQVGAGAVERSYDSARGLQALLHPLDADGGVLPADADGGRQLTPGEFARDLQPPQGQQLPVLVVEPAHRLRDLAPLALQLEPQYGEFGEVGGSVGGLVAQGVGAYGGVRGPGSAASRSRRATTGSCPGRAVSRGCRRPGAWSPARRRPRPRDRSGPGRRCCRPAAASPRPARPAPAGHRPAPQRWWSASAACPRGPFGGGDWSDG